LGIGGHDEIVSNGETSPERKKATGNTESTTLAPSPYCEQAGVVSTYTAIIRWPGATF